MPEREFSFVSLSGRPTEDARATSKAVRSHVMRRYKRQQRSRKDRKGEHSIHSDVFGDLDSTYDSLAGLADSASSAGSLAIEDGAHSPALSLKSKGSDWKSDIIVFSSKPRVVKESVSPLSPDHGSDRWRCYLQDKPSDLKTFLDGSLDPFGSLPIRATPRSLMLLHQNATLTIRTSVHADPDPDPANSLWRWLLREDAAWIFVSMFYAAARFPASLRQDVSEHTGYLVQALSTLNDNIARSPTNISDSTIATVSCLANVQNLNGTAADANAHMAGLVRMVELRGGLQNLGMRGILRRMVLWSDLLHISRSAGTPHFAFVQMEQPFHISHFAPNSSLKDYSINLSDYLEPIVTAKHRVTISEILSLLHELSAFLNALPMRNLPWEANYPDRVYEIEYRILISLFDDEITADSDDQIWVGMILLHASLLFIYTNLREAPVGGAIRSQLLSRLRSALEAACTGEDQVALAHGVGKICMENDICTWRDIETLLRSLPAFTTGYATKCMLVWDGLGQGCSLGNDRSGGIGLRPT